MIELGIVHRMIRRGLLLSPVVIGALAAFGGGEWALSGAIGVALTLINLWLAARIIGGIAENRPDLLVVAAFVAFVVGLGIVVLAGILLTRVDAVDFPVTGLTLVGMHLTLVTWEAVDAFLKIDSSKKNDLPAKRTRSRMHGT